MTKLAILGRQPEIGLAELESVLGAASIVPLNSHVCSIATESLELSCFGSVLKLGTVIESGLSDWKAVLRFIEKDVLDKSGDNKFSVGLSLHGLREMQPVHRDLLQLKKNLRGRASLRIVNQPRDTTLSSAQVLHNRLVGDRAKGQEYLVAKNDQATWTVAITEEIQDFEGYAKRDREKPMRDAKNGMLPPKLAQILVNLTSPDENSVILDPFCGTGTVLMEGMLLGYTMMGSDLSPTLAYAARENVKWLQENFDVPGSTISVEAGDAQDMTWSPNITHVACETYLGPPLSSLPSKEDLNNIITEMDKLHRNFLVNLQQQIKSENKLAIAVPAWNLGKNYWKRLPLVDDLENLGYNRVDLVHAPQRLIYHRDNQLVGRDILILKKKDL